MEDTFGADIDFGQLIKLFSSPLEEGRERYVPGGLAAIIKERICGNPDDVNWHFGFLQPVQAAHHIEGLHTCDGSRRHKPHLVY